MSAVGIWKHFFTNFLTQYKKISSVISDQKCFISDTLSFTLYTTDSGLKHQVKLHTGKVHNSHKISVRLGYNK